jgi:hypothetical protein
VIARIQISAKNPRHAQPVVEREAAEFLFEGVKNF